MTTSHGVSHNMLALQQVISRLESIPAVNAVRDLAEREAAEVYLIGEAVRDLFLGNTPNSYFFVIKGNVADFAQKLSEVIPGEVKDFNSETGRSSSFRGDCANLGFQYLNGTGLSEFMSRAAEFTVNTLAFDLRRQEVLDFCGGIADIEKKVIRLITPLPETTHGPGGLLRAVRHAQINASFSLSPQTYRNIRNHRELLQGASPALVGRELSQILTSDEYLKGIGLLDKLGLTGEVFRTFLPCAMASTGRGTGSNDFHVAEVLRMCRMIDQLVPGGDDFLLRNINLLRHVTLLTPIVRRSLLLLSPDEKRCFLFEWGALVEKQLIELSHTSTFAFRARVVSIGYLANAVSQPEQSTGTQELEAAVEQVIADFGKWKGLLCAVIICADFLCAVEGSGLNTVDRTTVQEILRSKIPLPISMHSEAVTVA